MNNSARFIAILLALGSVHCGSSGDDSNSAGTDGTVNPGDGTDGSNMPGDGEGMNTDNDMDPITGDGMASDDDAGTMQEDPPVTGSEPECVSAFTRVAECYLTREQCVDGADSNAAILGQGLAMTNCKTFADGAGGLPELSALWNENTPCDDQSLTALYPMLDQNAQLKELCEAEALDAAACTSSCNNIVPCAGDLPDAMASMALGDQTNCEANCTMQPALSPLFRCALNAGAECTAVVACFSP